MTTPPKLTLWVDGRIHSGWTAAGVELALTQLSNAFTLEVTDGTATGQPAPIAISPGAACRLEIAGQRVITGWVDQVSPSFAASSHTIAVSGRDAAGDLCDCSAEIGEWRGQTLETIVAALCRPFGVAVSVQDGVDTGEAFSRFAVSAGDSVQECIERLARQRGLLVWSTGLGGLIIGRGRAGVPVTRLRRGQHILDASGQNSHSERFSRITVMGAKEGASDLWGDDSATVTQSMGVASDPEITRYRPLILSPETQGSSLSMGERAEWERRSRAGKGRQYSVSVQGWFAIADTLWRPGQTVSLTDDWLGADGDYVVSAVRLDLTDSGGTTAALTLVPPEALDTLAEPEAAKSGTSGKAESDLWS